MAYTPKGIRLNNPFNLEKNPAIKWEGLRADSLEPVFCEFISNLYGLRAGFINLKNQLKEGYTTVTKLITKFAPPSENNTSAYIAAVCKHLNVNSDDELTTFNIKALAEAIIMREQGYLPYSDATLVQAMDMAGVNIYDENNVTAKPSVLNSVCNCILSVFK